MKRLFFLVGLGLLLVLVRISVRACPAYADDLIFETFDNWKNPFVAEGWGTHSVSGTGGEYNQIYEAAQEMTAGPGDVAYYRSIYKDFTVVPGKEYAVQYKYISSASWIARLQFYDAGNRLVFTVASETPALPWTEGTWQVPRFWGIEAALAPPGSSRMRLVFQAGPEDVVVLREVVLYEAKKTLASQSQQQYTYEKIAGPFINRNTEFSQGVNQAFGAFTFGNLAGEYKIRPAGGSSQGISAGGTFADFRSVYKDLKVTPGQKYKLSVDVVSNSTNETGTRVPSPVRIWIQYDDKEGRVLSTHGIDGSQAGIKDSEWTNATVPGPSGEPYTTAPPGTDHARVILQVMGGISGGTVFDNVSFTRFEN